MASKWLLHNPVKPEAHTHTDWRARTHADCYQITFLRNGWQQEVTRVGGGK